MLVNTNMISPIYYYDCDAYLGDNPRLLSGVPWTTHSTIYNYICESPYSDFWTTYTFSVVHAHNEERTPPEHKGDFMEGTTCFGAFDGVQLFLLAEYRKRAKKQ